MLSPGPTLVVTRDNFCPEGRRVSSKSPKGQKLSPRENNKKFVSSRKKEDFETFLGRKHWKNSNMALAGKDKAATLKKNLE